MSKKLENIGKILICIGLTILLLAAFSRLTEKICDAAELKIQMLDVGQGDAILIQSETQNTLIDTGDLSGYEKLVAGLQAAGVLNLDKLILTHPHADHIANAYGIINLFPAATVYDNGKISTSPFYKRYIKLKTPEILKGGDVLNLGDGVTLEVIAPTDLLVKNINNTSIVGTLRYGNFSMLFTGDYENEETLDIGKVDVLKAGHHGSKTSASLKFLEKAQPGSVVISCGLENKYGHPHKTALENFLAVSTNPENIFCTAYQGNILIVTDGTDYSITTEKDNSGWLEEYMGARVSVTEITE